MTKLFLKEGFYNSVLDLGDLFKKQQQLTDYILKERGIDKGSYYKDKNNGYVDKEKCATIDELFETVKELKSEGYKFWSVKGRNSENLVEEATDILFFLLQFGNRFNVPTEHHYIEFSKDIITQTLGLTHTILLMDGPIYWTMAMSQYRGLLQLLELDFEKDILPAYDIKYKENVDRQKRGY